MINQPLISVIIPVYNGEGYVRDAIQSAINQSYVNIEVIIVNDGSSDNTLNICKQYENDNRIVILNKPNGGAASARNLGLRYAKGSYIQFLDSDDSLLPETLEYVIENLTSEIDVAIYGFNIYSSKTLIRTPHCMDGIYRGSYDKFKEIYKVFSSPCNKLYKTSYIQHYFDESCVYGEDGIFNFANLTKDTIILTLSKCLYNVRLDSPDSVNKRYKKGRLDDTIRSLISRASKISELFGASNMRKDFLNDFYATVCFTIILCASRLPYVLFKSELDSVLSSADFLSYHQSEFGHTKLKPHNRVIINLMMTRSYKLLYVVAQAMHIVKKFL